MQSKKTIIEFKNIVKTYGVGDTKTYALNGVNLSIKEGEFVAIMGASGSGKSTAMNMIGCLDKPSSGEYLFNGISVGDLNRNQMALLRRTYLGFVFQSFNLLGRTSALENVELPLVYRKIPAKERKKLAFEALSKVGLQSVVNNTPAQLSGGQQQRVAIARAIVSSPLVLLADEPTGNLDSIKSIEIMNLLKQLNEDENITVIMVTHEEEMAAFANRIIYFRDGNIEDSLKKGFK
ncbi:MAG: ABC transporter ATP-binding protein [Aliarcobacter sp.]|jgi:putative ABC transport system ATP-binding protein|nr:ABC transporter ATP-binding protein [Aliarcobacter sp.]MDX9900461.1 ABC transporter ATP-binding protein [Aliarcobacter sp.]